MNHAMVASSALPVSSGLSDMTADTAGGCPKAVSTKPPPCVSHADSAGSGHAPNACADHVHVPSAASLLLYTTCPTQVYFPLRPGMLFPDALAALSPPTDSGSDRYGRQARTCRRPARGLDSGRCFCTFVSYVNVASYVIRRSDGPFTPWSGENCVTPGASDRVK